jgi:hypothetical protein
MTQSFDFSFFYSVLFFDTSYSCSGIVKQDEEKEKEKSSSVEFSFLVCSTPMPCHRIALLALFINA